MRIAFLCKRRYMGKDVVDDRYARLYELPFQLARLGHTVRGYCFGYQGQPDAVVTHDARPGELTWESRAFRRTRPWQCLAYPVRLLSRLRAFAPDLLIGASDIPHVVLAAWLARRLSVPYAVDLYDNFEGFGQARLPGMKQLLRAATRHAGVVTTTSEPLRRLVIEGYRALGRVLAMPSTADLAVFRPRDRRHCRQALGLPEDALLIGTAGGLYADKGVVALYHAWPRIAALHPDAHLVLAGPHDGSLPAPGPRVHYLGQLPHARTAELFAALDLGVIYLRDTPFGRYCFPQKAYEMLACGLPVVAASIGAMADLLADVPSALYRADDVDDLVRAIDAQLRACKRPAVVIEDWASIIARVEPALVALPSAARRLKESQPPAQASS